MTRKKILILRPDNIGDVLLFTGALRHIRNLYPGAYITFAVQAHIVNLVELCPYVDACVPYTQLTLYAGGERLKSPFKHGVENFIRVANKLWNSVRRPFDIVIYPVKSPQVNHLEVIYCLHAAQTLGITGCPLHTPKNGYSAKINPRGLFTEYFDVSRADPWQHELLTTVDFLVWGGCRQATLNDSMPQFWLSNSEKDYLAGVQSNGRKIIGLFPGASSKEKIWGYGNYGELAKLLGERLIYVIFGSPADKALTDQVALSITEHAESPEILNLTGQTTLRELAKTIMSCDLLISMDTAGLHMAIAAGVPSIGIVGGGYFGRFVPWGDPGKNIFLTRKMECFNCKWRCTKKEVECVTGVTPQEVAQAAAKLLKQK